MENNAILALADGSIFYGKSIGASGSFRGEAVFNTSLTGYQEILTDSSYAGQIIVFTTSHVGNVGVNEEDMESDRIWAGGMVTRSYRSHLSNWRAQGDLKSFLKEQGVMGISEIDTRALTHVLRKKGSQMACLMAGDVDPDFAVEQASRSSELDNENLVNQVTCKKIYSLSSHKNKFHVVVIDFGVKRSILHKLLALGCNLTVVPASITCEQILQFSPDGVFLSNGPGDPANCTQIINDIQELLTHNIPLFGICLGHQLLALASGAKTTKMIAGHHGANHPIIDLETKRVLISSQNHNFVVSESQLPMYLKVTYRSLFDGTVAGICRTDTPAFGFQGHPEASPGPHDLYGLFERFTELMERSYAQKR